MHILIDWLSFTIPSQPLDSARSDVNEINIRKALRHADMPFGLELTPCKNRKPYQIGYHIFPGCKVYAGQQDHVLIELSGQGCAAIRHLLEELLKSVHSTVTRIDLAADMNCNTAPETFVEYSNAKRFRSKSVITSDKGQTVYIGSPKSDRYARVYRYTEPHPRAKDLRCEMVFRRKLAKQVSEYIALNGLEQALQAFSADFGWMHPSWELQALETLTKPVVARARSDDKTVRWLIEQVAPAFKRLVENGAIQEPEKFVREYLL